MTVPVGPTPQSTERLEQDLAQLRRDFTEFQRKTLNSAAVGAGGLRVYQGGSLTAESPTGVKVLYIGPDTQGRQIFQVRRRDGSVMLTTATHANGEVFWTLEDRSGNVLVSDDAQTGVGLGSPWQAVPMYPKVWPTAFLDAAGTDLTLPVSSCNGSAVWEGRIGRVVHARIWADMVCGRVTGASGNPTYSLKVNGNTVGTWNQVGYSAALHGPYDITSLIQGENIPVQVTVSATGTGTDRIAAQMLGVHCRGG